MKLIAWDSLPEELKTEEIKVYYQMLMRKKNSLFVKRVFDVVLSCALIVLFSWLFILIGLVIKLDSPGPVFFRQERITQYGRSFRIFKFRTMTTVQMCSASLVTVDNDPRVTRVGRVLRRYRLDEISQLLDVLRGTMSFVGPRPEVPRYVAQYSPWMRAALLMPAGITSSASILFKDEAKMLQGCDDIDRAYIEKVLPIKMRVNIEDLASFSIIREFSIIFCTVTAVIGIGDKRIEKTKA